VCRTVDLSEPLAVASDDGDARFGVLSDYFAHECLAEATGCASDEKNMRYCWIHFLLCLIVGLLCIRV